MNDIIELAMAAHGGLEHWNKVRQVSLTFAPSGPGLVARGPIGEAFTTLPTRVTVDTRVQKVTIDPFLKAGQTGVYEPDRTAVLSVGGEVIEALGNPRDSFKALPPGSHWSGPQLIYFAGYSLWMYLTLPYSFARDGVQVEEVEPWTENGETWRTLRVTYPGSYRSHSTEQFHYFDSRGLMRRQDYTVDVRHDIKTAHYMSDFQVVDGFVFPTKRRICVRGPDRAPLWDHTLIAADLSQFELRYGGPD